MEFRVKKIDDINFVISGTIKNSHIEQKVAALKVKESEAQNESSVSHEKFEQRAAGQVFQEFIDAAIADASIDRATLLGEPALKKYEKNDETVYFEVDISIAPKIDVNFERSAIIPSYVKPQASAEAIDAKMNEFALKQAPFSTIQTPRAVEDGDVAVIDFTGLLNGEAFEGGSAQKYNLKIGSKSFIPGFEEQIIGMEYGEQRTITVTFPQNYQSEDLAGKETQFIVKLHEIQEQRPENIDDEYAKRILSDPNATVETLKEKFAEQVVSEDLSNLYNEELKPKIVSALLERFDFVLPNNLLEQEINAMIMDKMRFLSKEEQQSYQDNKEKFQELRAEYENQAKDNVKLTLIVNALAEQDGLVVDEQEVIAALTYQAMMSGQDAKALVQYYREHNLMQSAVQGLKEDKLFGQMLEFHK